MAFDPSKYTVAKARPLPVILLLDGSGSMSGEKISTLNSAVNEMITSFKNESVREIDIQVGIITFGGLGSCYSFPLQNVSNINTIDLKANGGTPMGKALEMAKDLIEDKEIIPSSGYRPAVVLVSDGAPTDSWEEPMKAFISNGRSSKCDRFAMEIMAGQQGEAVLNKFLEGTENQLFHANDASKILEFFRFVTMSVSVRSRSQDPNKLIPAKAMQISKASGNTIEEVNAAIEDMLDF